LVALTIMPVLSRAKRKMVPAVLILTSSMANAEDAAPAPQPNDDFSIVKKCWQTKARMTLTTKAGTLVSHACRRTPKRANAFPAANRTRIVQWQLVQADCGSARRPC
jgi:hypothetical protein